MKKNVLIFGFMVAAAVSLLIAYREFAFAKEVIINNPPQNTPPPTPKPVVDFQQKIQQGVSMLRASAPLAVEYKKNLRGRILGEVSRKQIAFAILDTNSGEIFEKRVWVSEDKIRMYPRTGLMQFNPVVANDSLDIQPRWWNSFNSFHEIAGRPDLAIVANKYPLQSGALGTLPEKSKLKYTDIIYVPYSDALRRPEIVAAGKKYVDDSVDKAFNQLDVNRVMSVSSPGHLATEGVTKDFIKNIILVEHIDPVGFLASDDGGQELSERVLALIGANQGWAYRYTGSPAGASGLAQFIRPTYDAVRARYPAAKLIKDYKLGMADHVNAMEAMVLFFDNYRRAITSRLAPSVAAQLGINEEILAATYNGGPGNVVRAIKTGGVAAVSEQFDYSRIGKFFRTETLNYIKKFRSIKGLNIF